MEVVPAFPPESIVEQLDKVLASSVFQGAERSRTLLRFLVERTVDGQSDGLKEYTLGAEALGKGQGFDPRTDPIVRAEASRLRGRLERYYATDGRGDSVVIALPKGSYVPQFHRRSPPVEIQGDATADGTPRRSSRLRWFALVGVLAAAGAFIGTLWAWRLGKPPSETPLVRLDVELRSGGALGSEVGTDVVLSPDGTRIVFVSKDLDGTARLHARRLDQSAVTALPGTEGARGPVISPDGRWVAFWANGKLKKTPVDGGSPISLCDAVDLLGATWREDGDIIAAMGFGKLWRVPSSTGQPTVLVDLAGDSVDPRWPQILPGGTHLLFTAVGPQGADRANIETLSLADGKRRVLVRGATFGRYLSNGYLSYVNQGTLFAVPFDLDRMETPLTGTPMPVLDHVSYSSTFGFAQLDVSRTGTLIYQRSTARGQLIAAWVDRSGRTDALSAKPGHYTFPSLSPDGQRFAVSLTESGTVNIWLHGLLRHPTVPLNSTPGESAPTWTPDGRFLVLGSRKGLYWMNGDGTGAAQPLTRSDTVQVPWSFTPDGTRLALYALSSSTGFDLWTVPIQATGNGLTAGTPELLVQTPSYETYPSFSPDGRWVAYGSGAYGKWEVYVRPFPGNGTEEVQVSRGGGRIARWLRNGRELLYRTDDQRIMVATYTVKDGSFSVDTPRVWSPVRLGDTGVLSNFDVDPSGQRILALIPPAGREDQQTQNHATFVLNFFDEVRRRVSPAAK